MNKDRLLASLALITVAALWGIAAPIIKLTYREIPPFTFLFFRFLVTIIAIIPIYAIYEEKKKLTSKDFLELSGIGFLGITLTIGLIFYGLNLTTALDMVLIGLLGPLLVVIGGALFLKEEVTRLEKIGLGFAILGSIITVIQPILEEGFAGSEALLGNILIFFSSVTFAAYALLAKKVSKKYSPLTITTIPTGISVICFAPLFVMEYLNDPGIVENLFTPLAIFGILYMAILSYILAYLLYQWGLSKIEASEAAVFGYLNPVFAFPVAYIFLGERPTIFIFIGAALIALGVILTEWKPQSDSRESRRNKFIRGGKLFKQLSSLDLPSKDYAIFGSGPLFAHCIVNKLDDLDLIARGEAWKKARKISKIAKAPSGDKVLHPLGNKKIEIFKDWVPHKEWDVDDLIDNAETIGGFRFVRLEDVLKSKVLLDRPKDKDHIKIIGEYLEKNPATC